MSVPVWSHVLFEGMMSLPVWSHVHSGGSGAVLGEGIWCQRGLVRAGGSGPREVGSDRIRTTCPL